MTRGEAVKRLIMNLRGDLARYEAFGDLLEKQLLAALSHDGVEMSRINAEVLVLAETLSVNLKARRVLAASIVGGDGPATIGDVLAKLSAAPREVLSRESQRFAECVERCKRLNERNAELIVSQQEILQRVFQKGDDLYAPN
ncbi:flagellar protein FlgN [Burkholderia ubonensis]|uniref:flagellar protein FlgN n=1 Tax=Burkholderia ubonensis TaxID=101571 RepID=UPI0007563AF3|nr:flagellar protein FlgN [Burkholderia ubonensis]KWB79416.1 hypothetical protein WL42_12705 [Burkholderia ubonensis]